MTICVLICIAQYIRNSSGGNCRSFVRDGDTDVGRSGIPIYCIDDVAESVISHDDGQVFVVGIRGSDRLGV